MTNATTRAMTRTSSGRASSHRACLLPLAFSLVSLLSLSAQADTKVRASSFEYNAQGLLTKEVIEPTSPNDCLQTSYVYDSYGHKISASSSACAGASGPAIASAAVARTSSASFSADGRFPVSSSNALNQTETKVYDTRFGVVTSLTGPNGLTTSWQYDSFGRKTKEARSDGTTTTWAYKLCTDVGAACPGPIGTIGGGAVSVSVVISQSFAVNLAVNSPEQRSYYDALGRLLRSQSQGFDVNTSGAAMAAPTLVSDTEYNALGQVARQSNSYALAGSGGGAGSPVWSSYTYDALGRATQESHPDPAASGGIATTSTAYNGLSFTLTNPKGQTKTTTKNAQGQIAVVADNNGQTISYSFDALGYLLSTNAAGSITTMVYNQRGQKVSMLDPAMGSWVYNYNVYGELVSQRNSLNQSVSMSYDVLGRMTQRLDPELASYWSYDKKFDGSACGKGIGKLCEAKSNNGYNRLHTYDSLGRPTATATVLNDPVVPAVVSEAYDANTGRVASKTWPTGYPANYQYSPLGYLKGVTAGGIPAFPQAVSYAVQAINAQGQITQYRTGNQVTTVKTIDPISQRLLSLSATTDGQSTGNVLNHSYTYDSLNNLMSRADNSPGVGTQESFSYDTLNRLTTATLLGGGVSPPSTTAVMYDVRGNITYKSDVGQYWYDAQRPNRMTQVTLSAPAGATQPLTGTRALSYAFDDLKAGAQLVNGLSTGNGNLEYTVSHDTANNVHTVRSETYFSYNMPSSISYGNFITNTTHSQDRTLSFVYGPEHQRIRQTITLTGNGTSKYFAGNVWYLNGEDSLGLSYEKEVRTNGTTEHKHYIKAAGLTFAEFVSRTGTLNGLPATTTNYFHHDQLGSISAITSETGVVSERLAYDPWGKRRFVNTSNTPPIVSGQSDKLDAIVGIKTDRGYTEHEHLDEVGIIHMNGRIYDPLIGRFMSADPYIQAPTNLKTFNRYAYVWNNPLKAYDPDGFNRMLMLRLSDGGDFGDNAGDGGYEGGGEPGGGAGEPGRNENRSGNEPGNDDNKTGPNEVPRPEGNNTSGPCLAPCRVDIVGKREPLVINVNPYSQPNRDRRDLLAGGLVLGAGATVSAPVVLGAVAIVALVNYGKDILNGFKALIAKLNAVLSVDGAKDVAPTTAPNPQNTTDDGVKIDDKIAGQLGDRGWTEQDIQDITKGSPAGSTTDNRTPGKTPDGLGRNDPASVYGTKDGYVVVNDRTREVVQVSDRTPGSGWLPDRRIVWNK